MNKHSLYTMHYVMKLQNGDVLILKHNKNIDTIVPDYINLHIHNLEHILHEHIWG